VLLIGIGGAAALRVTGIGAAFRTRRASPPIPAEGYWGVPAVAHANASVRAADHSGNAKSRAGASRERLPSGSVPASASEDLDYRRLDGRGRARLRSTMVNALRGCRERLLFVATRLDLVARHVSATRLHAISWLATRI